MTALNLARFTTNRLFTLVHTAATSDPICSPSRSQSVHMIRRSALRASFFRLRSTVLRFYGSQLEDHVFPPLRRCPQQPFAAMTRRLKTVSD